MENKVLEKIVTTAKICKELKEADISIFVDFYSGAHVNSDWFLKNISEYQHRNRPCDQFPFEYSAVIDGVKIYCILTEEEHREILGGKKN